MTNSILEPIKTAVVMGNYAEARKLRAELLESELREVLDIMSDPMKFIDGAPIAYVERIEALLDSLDSLGIQEET